MKKTTDITIIITRSVALELVKLAGLEMDASGRYGGKYFQLDEATTVAVVEIAESAPLKDRHAEFDANDRSTWQAWRVRAEQDRSS